ncbi:hypothetical protein E4U39_001314 [Claviceps sp. Clav50 group G5]|nr:hypothetical protein E4U39_001314 [Claviceps sp. Clav50 group G5]
MVRTSLVASLLAASASSLAAKSVVPGTYIFELENGQDVSAFEQTMTGDGKTRMKLEYDLFSVSLVFQFNYTTSKRPSRQWRNMLRCLRSKRCTRSPFTTCGIFYASSPADGQHVSAIASFDNLQMPSVLHLSK